MNVNTTVLTRNDSSIEENKIPEGHVKSIGDLFELQKAIWRHENEYWFGITPTHDWNIKAEADRALNYAVEHFWNNGTCEFKKLLESGKCNDFDCFVPGSYELCYDNSGIICLYGTFKWKKTKRSGGEETIERRSPIAYLPCPDDLCWYLGDSRYVLRINATNNYGAIRRIENFCYYQKMWKYDIENDAIIPIGYDPEEKDENGNAIFDPFKNLTYVNKEMISAFAGVNPDDLTEEKFYKTLKILPEWDSSSVYNFKFDWVDGMFDMVRTSKRFANPTMRVPVAIHVVKMFTSHYKRNERGTTESANNNLILTNSDLFALENARTVIYKNDFNSNFFFTDTERFFDSFKTSTNKSAGKSRLILDQVFVKDGKLWVKIDDNIYDMFTLHASDVKYIAQNKEASIPKGKSLSVLSSSNFGGNNAPKRIMMTAKLRAQAVNVVGERDPFTHEVPARIVFGDWKGFNFGDSIIISRSFARKLRSKKQKKIRIDNEQFRFLESKYKIGNQMSISDLQYIARSNMFNNYRNIIIDNLENDLLVISADAPFSVGDKLTNLHGSKGIVSLILEDSKMPYIKEDIGNFPAGPFDIIVSGLSVYRRKSLGQLFEAWASAMGYDDVNSVADAVAKYSNEMKEFSERSIVYMNDSNGNPIDPEGVIKPIGINVILRLDHDSVGKQSLSYVKSNYARMLKFGEMELLNLAARSLWNIMNEIDIRSICKHHNAFEQIFNMQKTGECCNEPANALRFFNTLRCIGFDFNIANPNIGYTNWTTKKTVLDDEEVVDE